jgi:hypothetical protein
MQGQNISPELLNAVIQQESGGNPNAVSPVGAAGIMQIMPDTARDPGFGVTPLQGWDGVDPRTAPVSEQIRFGRDYLEAMNREFGGDQSLTLAAYNAGPGAVQEYGGVPPYEETQNYVRNINAAAPPEQGQLQAPQQQATATDWRSRANPVQIQGQQLDAPTPMSSDASNSWRNRATAVEEKPGFVERVKNVVKENEAQMQRSADAYVAGEQSGVETAAQQALSFASNVPDILMEGVSTVTPQFVKDAGMAAVRQVGKLPTFDGSTLGESIPGELQMLSENHPRLARNTQAVMDGLSLVPAGKAVAATAKGTGKVATKAGTKLLTKKVAPKTAQELKDMAGAAFKQADELNATFTPSQVGGPLGKALKEARPKPIAGKVLTQEDKLLLSHLDDFQGLERKPLSLTDIKRIDESIGQKITTSFVDAKTGLPDANGRRLMILQENLRKIVDDVPDNAANDALINARSLWKAQTIMRDLDDIAERASMSQNTALALRSGYRALYNNKKRMRGWPKEAKELLKKAATPSVSDAFLDTVSGRLLATILGGTGNFGAAATAHVIGAGGRGMKAKIAAKAGARTQQAIVDDAVGGLRKVTPPGEGVPALLAAPGKMSAAPLTDRQIKIMQKQLQTKPSTKPDVDGIIKLDDKTKGKN